jgi:hypothetical protein
MKINLIKLVPTRVEVFFLLILALILSILWNGHALLSYYGLTPSASFLSTSTSAQLQTGLAHLDHYKFTATIVTFAVWAIIGLVTLSVLQAIFSLSRTVDYQKKLSSNAYVHPSNFTRKSFWRSVATASIRTFIIAFITLMYFAFFCFYLVPLGGVYAAGFLLDMTASNALYLVIGEAILFFSLVLLDVAVRLVRFRHELTR